MTHTIIHAGPHKTGSTYLQRSLAHSRRWLRGNNILFPADWGMEAHHALTAALAQPHRDEDLEQRLSALLAGGFDHMVLSCEGLLGLPEERLAYLRTLLGGGEVTIVYYIRAWSALLPSFWQEEVKGGRMVRLLPDFLYRSTTQPAQQALVNFGLDIERAITVFGRENVKLVAYDQLLDDGQDLFLHFAGAFLGRDDIPSPGLARSNVSLGAAACETLRALAAMEWRLRKAAPPATFFFRLSQAYLAEESRLRGSVLADALKAHEDAVPFDETAEPLASLHRALYDSYRDLLVPPVSKDLFFAPRLASLPFISPDYLSVSNVVEELAGLHQTLRDLAK